MEKKTNPKYQKTSKSALVTSVLSLVLCFAMLIGTTLAWFTDSVTSTGNIIKSGTLDVEMYYADGKENPDDVKWTDASQEAIFNYDKWEPGYTEVYHIKISNEGSLALKYQLNIVANGKVSELADVIDVYFIDPAIQVSDRTALAESAPVETLTNVLNGMSETANGDLLNGESDIVTIALKMQETAGNEYQDLSIGTDFSVQLVATQLTSETDSFDNQYDKMATIDDEDELGEALAADYDLIQLGANITLTDSVVIPEGKTVAIDLAGYTMSQAKGDLTAAYAMIYNKGTLTIEDSVGVGKVSFADTTPYTAEIGWASNTIRNEGVLTVNGGTVENITAAEVLQYSYPHAIDCYQGSTTTINGGTVKSLNYDSIRMFCNSETLATKVVINGGTIVNRVSFQDPQSTKAGYGILEINGGNFVTMNGVTANVRLLNFCKNCNNMKATVTGGTFDKGFKTQDIAESGIKTSDWLNMGTDVAVTTADELQDALNVAVDGTVIKLVAGITGDVTATEKPDVKVTIDGNGMTYAGVITVDGKSGTYITAGLTIKNMTFKADSISADACIRLGDGTNDTRYTCNVTVENCTFDVPDAVGVKSYTGGDKNLTISGCTATANAHSLAQLKGIDGVLVKDCTVNSVRGINFNNSNNIVVKNCTIDVQKYAVRFGESDNTTVENYEIIDSTISSNNVDGDAAIVLRKGATNANLTITNTTVSAGVKISGHESATIKGTI